MRVALISQPRDPIAASASQWGSVAIVTWELARRLARGNDVVIYAPRRGSEPEEEQGPDQVLVRRTGRALRRVHKALDLGTSLVGLRPPYFSCSLFFREYASALARMLVRDPPDVIHVQTWSQFLPVFRQALPSARIVLHAHDALLARLPRALIDERLAHADAVVTCSEFITQKWRERFPRYAARIHTIGNGVDLAHFHPPSSGASSSDAPLILYVGRVSPDKGVHILVRAFEQLLKHRPDATLTIVGPVGLLPYNQVSLCRDDPQVAAMLGFYGNGFARRLRKQVLGAKSSYAGALRASVSPVTLSRIRFVGSMQYRDLAEQYRRARLVAAPSVWPEPFGLPVAEAMASGVPVVATRTGGIPEIVEHGVTGTLVERGDVGALAQAMEDMLSDPARLVGMRRASRARAEAMFGWDAAVKRLEHVYHQLSV